MRHTHLYIVRHGRTDWNAEERIQGTVDRPLDEVGEREARDLAKIFAYTPVEVIYSSPLIRAKKTAEIFSETHPSPIFFEPDLREIDHGLIEGKKWHDYRVEYKDKIDHYTSLPTKERLAFKYTPRSESYGEVLGRVVPCLKKICKAHTGKHIVVISHGGVIKMLIAHLKSYDDTKIKVRNTGYAWVSGTEDELFLHQHRGVDLR